ncbi:energy transducer TonB [Vibrio cidicii]|uniref:Protein TonB n=2 Tax=Vibrio TaxID=662 RepID=A0AAI9CTV6_9VIBR|nr:MULTISPECIES: energy transducer TonB [Vibrio]EGR2795930.1 energy transducer TonB [Vibrio navarrensis]EHA1126682.1 TonB family protein [Vibrio navarrensis]EJL6395472.1 TonB family protein [Vibrio navarrensis]EJN6829298.1 TonB family protein [Vibrio cidicii]EKA5637520.1 TonB family protein [Vibrio navarrensis]
MLRLLLSLPVSLAMVFALFSAMAWMVNLGKLNGVTPSAPVSFNMVMFEAQSEVARRQRAVPPPPDVPPPPQPEVMKVSQTPMTTTSAQVEMPNVDMSFSVNGLAISVPSVGIPGNSVANNHQQLTPLSRVDAVYPAKAKKRGIEGYVLLRFDIDETGRPQNIEVVEAQPARFFERSAVDAVKRWRYQPQIVDGAAQPILGYSTRIEFKMQ